MGSITVERQAAFNLCDRYSDSLMALYQKLIGFEERFSAFPGYGVRSLQIAYWNYGYVATSLIRTMLTDINVMKTCFKNITTFDSYLKDYYSETATSNRFDIGCDHLWESEHIDSVILPEQPTFRCPSEGGFRIDSSDLEVLSELVEHVRAFRDDNIASCRTVVQEFIRTYAVEGLTAEACKHYLEDIHLRYLDDMDIVAQQFECYVTRYVERYRDDFPRTPYIYIEDELRSMINELSRALGRYRLIRSEADRRITEANDIISIALSTDVLTLEKIPGFNETKIDRNISWRVKEMREIADNIHSIEFNALGMSEDIENDLDRLVTYAQTANSLGSGYRVIQYRPQDRFNVLGLHDRMDNGAGSTVLRTENYARFAISGDRRRRDEAREYLQELLDAQIAECIQIDEDSCPEITDEVLRGWATIYYHLIESEFSGDVSEYLATYSVLFNADGVASYKDRDLEGIAVDAIRESAARYAENVADDPDCGYDQNDEEYINRGRYGLKHHGEPRDYDCSSLSYSCYIQAGIPFFDMGMRGSGSACSEVDTMKKLGFEDVTAECGNRIDKLERSDILVNDHHMETYTGNGYSVSAHGDETWGRSFESLANAQDDVKNYRADSWGRKPSDWDQVCKLGVDGDQIQQQLTDPQDPRYAEYFEYYKDNYADGVIVDENGHDRVGEIRFECIRDPENYDQIDPACGWQRVYRLKDLSAFKLGIEEPAIELPPVE